MHETLMLILTIALIPMIILAVVLSLVVIKEAVEYLSKKK